MRVAFAAAVAAAGADTTCAFLTGDLGFMALEPVREAFGERFVNVGVAEQNLMGVAAGLAREGMRVFAYSIAPFASLRAVEQLKLDIAGQGLSVCVVGNGGGYAYGHMGPSHHALEDVSVMCAIGMRVLVPAFDVEVTQMVATWTGPTYLRLGRQEVAPPAVVAGTAGMGLADSHRRSVHHTDDELCLLLTGGAGHLVALGPLAGVALSAFAEAPEGQRPNVWSCTALPLERLPPVLASVAPRERVVVFEEHRAIGGLGQQLGYALALAGRAPEFAHRSAVGYPSNRYGSQSFHRAESHLDAASMRALWNL